MQGNIFHPDIPNIRQEKELISCHWNNESLVPQCVPLSGSSFSHLLLLMEPELCSLAFWFIPKVSAVNYVASLCF